ncbi:MAG TPA: PQQ-dependent sugar dehydrogenase [Thermoanaerobaculia bacterium]|jgi:glucose/arabinose dehydrogenase
MTLPPSIRHPLVAALLAAGLSATAAPLAAVELSELRPELLAQGISAMTGITHAGDERLFLSRKAGVVSIFDGQTVLAKPFLDLSDRVLVGGEQGFFSIAFHPDHALNGYFFAYYTNLEGDVVISRFSVSDGDPSAADPLSEKVLLEIEQPTASHNGGQLQFGPDGYLYLAPGDGGGGNDPRCQAQDTTSLLGKILRLDVDVDAETPPYHGIPPTNPFVGDDGARDEIWAYGLRNPWRFSFDRVTGDLYVGDVGQSAREEVSLQGAASPGGENYGWKVMEGDACTGRTDGCDFEVPACGSPEYAGPILVYDHEEGCAVIGGYVYRGKAFPELDGVYFYGDLCSGTVWAARRSGETWLTEELGFTVPGLASFGEDADGELYMASGAKLFKLAGPQVDPAACRPDAQTLCLNGGRFRVTADWRTAERQGTGTAEPITEDAGYFWFFGPDNPELFVKLLDGCFDPFDTFWVFAAGLTEVGVTLTVEDTETDQVRVYENPLGRGFEPIRDTRAFATCP